MAVGELLLSAFFQVLFDRLASPELFNFARQEGLSSKLKKWEKKLVLIQAVLSDAEEKQLTDRAVKIWLDDLRDLAYDAEDVLDEFETKAVERKLMAENQSMIPACFSCFNPSTIKFNMNMDFKFKGITSRLEELCEQRLELGLQLIPGRTSSATQQRPPSTSVPIERAVYGRDEDKAKVLQMVLSCEPNDANFCVIPIVGMAGVGKTTLAREVYNSKAIEEFKFDIKAWVCVSDDFDVLSISRALLESITCIPCELKALNEVQVELRKAVDGKRFLLVLDDVWNDNYSLWETLKAPFMAGAPNSKIIATTRHSHVASTMGQIGHYNLKHLSDDDCWSVFLKHAFEGRDSNANQISELLQKKVVGKCGGLPLAARTLGGLLRSKRDDEWEGILDSEVWNLYTDSEILPVLRLSYYHLPSHLKRCFAYCAVFPKDYEFRKEELILLWMAEGIIQQPRDNKQVEDQGYEYFRDLVSRTIFQQSCSDSCKFVLHDLVHDLAKLVSGEIIFRLDEAKKKSRRFEGVRHFSYPCGLYAIKKKFEILNGVERLRTFLPVIVPGISGYYFMSSMVLLDLLQKFKKLRVLSLEGYYITHLPNSIKELRLIRYLNLANTMIISLPESVSSLYNLQILILRGCNSLQKLPSKLRNLINLRHLDIKGADFIREMPFGMKELTNLQTLSNFIVGKGTGSSGLKDMKNLMFLSGELCISGLEYVNDLWETREASLCEKQNLESLSLQWGSRFDNSQNQVAEESVLDLLKPHTNIKKLTITRYTGQRFPSWLGNPSLCNTVSLELISCQNCTSLPALGLLGSLRELTIRGMTGLKRIGSEIYGKDCLKPFQSLETLCLVNLPEWEYWDTSRYNEHVEIFRRLTDLTIAGCPKLSGNIPDNLPSLETLDIKGCQQLIVPFSSFPVLSKLEIYKCKGLVCKGPIDSKLMKSTVVSSSSLNIYGCKGMLYDGPTNSTSVLKSMIISNILEFGKLLKQGFQTVESLVICDSHLIQFWNLRDGVFPFHEPAQGLCILTHPEEVSIEENCIRPVSFPEVHFLPFNLRSLVIENIRALKSLPEEVMYNCGRLEILHIKGCDSLTFIVRGKLPLSLQTLRIFDCKKLQFLVEEDDSCASSSSSSSSSPMRFKSLHISCCSELTALSSRRRQLPEELEFLDIKDCAMLESVAESFHGNTRLERIRISNCENLKSIPKGLHNLSCLMELEILNCLSLVSFPERGLPITISSLIIDGCEKLKALPDSLNKLNSLEDLHIRKCPSIVSFPEEGFPTNLTSLEIDNVKMYKAMIQWGLHRITSLKSLGIGGCHDAATFPDEEMGMMLPTSLTRLSISRFWKLKCLSSISFQSLTSLEYLGIYNCPKLKSFPKAGLPSSLVALHIRGCSLLKKQCKRDEGKEWSKISHIPCVEIDDKFIFY